MTTEEFTPASEREISNLSVIYDDQTIVDIFNCLQKDQKSVEYFQSTLKALSELSKSDNFMKMTSKEKRDYIEKNSKYGKSKYFAVAALDLLYEIDSGYGKDKSYEIARDYLVYNVMSSLRNNEKGAIENAKDVTLRCTHDQEGMKKTITRKTSLIKLANIVADADKPEKVIEDEINKPAQVTPGGSGLNLLRTILFSFYDKDASFREYRKIIEEANKDVIEKAEKKNIDKEKKIKKEKDLLETKLTELKSEYEDKKPKITSCIEELNEKGQEIENILEPHIVKENEVIGDMNIKFYEQALKLNQYYTDYDVETAVKRVRNGSSNAKISIKEINSIAPTLYKIGTMHIKSNPIREQLNDNNQEIMTKNEELAGLENRIKTTEDLLNKTTSNLSKLEEYSTEDFIDDLTIITMKDGMNIYYRDPKRDLDVEIR